MNFEEGWKLINIHAPKIQSILHKIITIEEALCKPKVQVRLGTI